MIPVQVKIEVDDIESEIRFAYDTDLHRKAPLQSTAPTGEKGKRPIVRITTPKYGRYIFYASCVTGDDPPRAHAIHLVDGRPDAGACLNGVFCREFDVGSGKEKKEFELDCGVQCAKTEKAAQRYEQKLQMCFGTDGQPLVPSGQQYSMEKLGSTYFKKLKNRTVRLYYSLFYIREDQKTFMTSALSNVLTNVIIPTIKEVEPPHVPVTGGNIILLTSQIRKNSKVYLYISSGNHNDEVECAVLLQHLDYALHVAVPNMESMHLDFSAQDPCPEIQLRIVSGKLSSETYRIKVTRQLDSESCLASKRLQVDYESHFTSNCDSVLLEEHAATSSWSGASAASSVLVHHAQPRPVTNFAPARVAMPRQVLQSVPSSQASQPFDSCTLPKSGNVAYTEANTQPSTSVTNNGADLFVTDDLQSPDASSLLNLDFESILTDNDNEQESQPDCGDLLDFVLGLR